MRLCNRVRECLGDFPTLRVGWVRVESRRTRAYLYCRSFSQTTVMPQRRKDVTLMSAASATAENGASNGWEVPRQSKSRTRVQGIEESMQPRD